jgi:hypothetical protein
VVRRATSRAVTARTMKRRFQRQGELAERRRAARARPIQPETPTQARVWDRKYKRYIVAGLCLICAAQAAWGHSIGFGNINDPCDECQPLVNEFDTPGPRGSKWRKCLEKLEYLAPKEATP